MKASVVAQPYYLVRVFIGILLQGRWMFSLKIMGYRSGIKN
ncbi:hypothetical protein SAMN04487952_10924 [Halomonas caseinilytica]|nr:hypothetical protein SAMN04487952_10924 [Halomonas caseinilytica]